MPTLTTHRNPFMPSVGKKKAQQVAARRAAVREVIIPDIVNPQRRKSCRLDLLKFCQTYYRDRPSQKPQYRTKRGLFYLPEGPMHVEIIGDLQTRILYGGLEAISAPRGYGKDTLIEMAIMWGVCYGHIRHGVMGAYELKAAGKWLSEIKLQFEINDWLLEDFPEVCAPIRALGRSPQKAQKQTHDGEFTRVVWGADHIVLPSIGGGRGIARGKDGRYRRSQEGSVASGAVISIASIGGSVRGRNINGIRPDFASITDPQTRESSKSPVQTASIMEAIHQDFGGLAGHDDPLACVALMTIIRRNDIADQLTDRDMSPQWHGRRYKAIETWPAKMDLWDAYMDLLREGARAGDETGRTAHTFYLKNRKAMDKGSKVTWPDAFIKKDAEDGSELESSNLEHLFRLRYKWGEDAFDIEFQGEPPEEEGISGLTIDVIMGRLSMYPQFVAPKGFTRLVECIDVGSREIHYGVGAFDEHGSGVCIDYGILATDAPEGNLKTAKGATRTALEKRVLEALQARRDENLAASPYKSEDGKRLEIELHLVDSGWLTSVVYLMVKESGPRWRATKGDTNQPGSSRYASPRKKSKQTLKKWIGTNWYGVKQPNGLVLWHLDADEWKLYAHERFAQDPGTAGSFTLYGNSGNVHRRFAKHCVAEEYDLAQRRWIKWYRWNHFFDVTAGIHAGASMLGIRLLSGGVAKAQAAPAGGGWFANQKR